MFPSSWVGAVVTVPFLTVNSLATWLEWWTVMEEFWVRILAGPKDFSLWNGFNSVRSNSAMPETASGSGRGLYSVGTVDARL